MKVRDVIRRVERDGWQLAATKGSHRQYKHPVKKGNHRGASFARRAPKDVAQHTPAGGATLNYVAIFEKTRTGYSAHFPDLPGCIAAGRTLGETRRLIREAAQFHIQGLRADGERIPQPRTKADEVRVSA